MKIQRKINSRQIILNRKAGCLKNKAKEHIDGPIILNTIYRRVGGGGYGGGGRCGGSDDHGDEAAVFVVVNVVVNGIKHR